MFQFTGFASHPYVFRVRYSLRSGFPHSDISGSKLHCQLPRAFRRLARPSSPVIAKASTTCTYSLDPITLSSLPRTPSYRFNSFVLIRIVSTIQIDAITTVSLRPLHPDSSERRFRSNTTFFHFVKERVSFNSLRSEE